MISIPSDNDIIRTAPSPKCIACGSDGVELYVGLTDYLAGTPGTWRMVRCARASCAMLWLDPKPLASDLIKAYASYHTHSRPARGAAALGLSALNSACKLTSRLLELGCELGRQRRRLRTMFLGTAVPGRLLEVGCGSGRFLNRMRRAGWQVQGTDFDPAVAECMRGSGLHVELLQTLSVESAGIYRASDAMRKIQGDDRSAAAARSIVRSWFLRYTEYRQTLREPVAGQDIFLIAAK